MRICRFSTGEEPRFGVVTGEVDEFGQPAEDSVVVALSGDPLYVGIKLLEEHHKLSDVRLLAPIIPRSKVVGIGRNYAAHAAEMGNDVPAEPLMFLKPNTTVVGPGDPIFYPPQTSNLHYEGELAVVIGRGGRGIAAADAFVHVYGYTIVNDMTVREIQKRHVQFFLGKSAATYCPMGPALVTRDEVADVTALWVRTTVNGEERQAAPVSDLIFDIPSLIETISAWVELEPGDMIATGTPAGVGIGSTPPRYVRPGDVVEVTVDGLGTLSNPTV